MDMKKKSTETNFAAVDPRSAVDPAGGGARGGTHVIATVPPSNSIMSMNDIMIAGATRASPHSGGLEVLGHAVAKTRLVLCKYRGANCQHDRESK